jgi:D-hydroxyproline dehydrogenase subunit beta
MNCWDVVVAGAGIVGTACARALAREGFRVAVVEPHFVGSGATAAGMGHVVVMDDSPAQLTLTRYSQQLWDEISPSLPPSAEFQRCGTIWVAADETEFEAVLHKYATYAAQGVVSNAIDSEELYQREPNLRGGLRGGLLVPGDSVLYPPAAAQALMRHAEDDGAELRLGRRITEFHDDRVKLDNGETLASAYLVDAAGVAAGLLGIPMPIRPRKGHLVITERYPGFVKHQLIELGYLKSAHGQERSSVAFNVQPRITGQLLIGSSREFDATDSAVERDLLGRMLARATFFLPGLARLQAIRVWTGQRAATPDSLPIIGPWPEEPRCILAAGHEGLGITTSLGTAELVVAELLQREPPIAAAPYSPERFLAVRSGLQHGH